MSINFEVYFAKITDMPRRKKHKITETVCGFLKKKVCAFLQNNFEGFSI